MTDVAHRLRLKYGLTHQPSDSEVTRWANETERLRREGISQEGAGRRAAESIFPDFNRVIFKAEADTIEALLEAARKR